MMKLYLAVSEQLEQCYDGYSLDPPEPYCIAELVVAQSRNQAIWLAWKSDRSFTGDVRDIPRFSCRAKARLTEDVIPGIVSKREEYSHYWNDE